MSESSQDFSNKVLEFQSAFEQIVKEGFFTQIETNVMGLSGHPAMFLISASGKIPNSPENSFSGVTPIFSIPDFLEPIGNFIERGGRIKEVAVKVERKDWLLYDSTGNTIIGSRGTSIKMSFSILFHEEKHHRRV